MSTLSLKISKVDRGEGGWMMSEFIPVEKYRIMSEGFMAAEREVRRLKAIIEDMEGMVD